MAGAAPSSCNEDCLHGAPQAPHAACPKTTGSGRDDYQGWPWPCDAAMVSTGASAPSRSDDDHKGCARFLHASSHVCDGRVRRQASSATDDRYRAQGFHASTPGDDGSVVDMAWRFGARHWPPAWSGALRTWGRVSARTPRNGGGPPSGTPEESCVRGELMLAGDATMYDARHDA